MYATTKYTKAAGLNLFYSAEYDISTNIILGITVKHPAKDCYLVFSSDLEIIGISTQRATHIDKDTLSNFRYAAKEALSVIRGEFEK